MNWTELITIITPALTAVAGWFIGRRRQKNNFLRELQSSIDLLASENRRLLNENIEFQKRMIELELKVCRLESKIKKQ
jgi:hypothetical protein